MYNKASNTIQTSMHISRSRITEQISIVFLIETRTGDLAEEVSKELANECTEAQVKDSKRKAYFLRELLLLPPHKRKKNTPKNIS